MCRNREAFQGAPQGTRRDPAECKVSEAPTAAGFRGAEMYDGSREADAGGLERQSPAWGVYARSRGACSRTMLVESAEQARQRGRWLSMWATRRHDAPSPQPLARSLCAASTARALLDRGAESTEAAPITHGPASGCVVERLRGLLVRVGKVLERERQARLGWAALRGEDLEVVAYAMGTMSVYPEPAQGGAQVSSATRITSPGEATVGAAAGQRQSGAEARRGGNGAAAVLEREGWGPVLPLPRLAPGRSWRRSSGAPVVVTAGAGEYDAAGAAAAA
eukprot:CAMPEP_0198427872 /NCGR_PEP_ID=MMETSP1452-20131203/6201_1 /TAXON_ID=1181717 /ORGANISM="Synchroma pusillum, Strain CCMP3072" /LENGTH=277 /DNA_ID=CAMNT_0044148249 /DNA_START=47 /DNA_END=878 /DNA_ORIENTATION=+